MQKKSTYKRIFKAASQAIVYALVFSLLCPAQAFAARSGVGGGTDVKPDWGEVAENVGITIGAAVGGAYLSSTFNSAWNTANPGVQTTNNIAVQSNLLSDLGNNVGNTLRATGQLLTHPVKHFGAGLTSMNSLAEVAPIVIQGYATYTAGTQVSRAIGMAGQYYEWSPKATYAIAGLGVGVTTGFLNPSAALGESFGPSVSMGSAMLKGAFVGGLSGWASAATIGAIDGDKLNNNENPGITAQMLGTGMGILSTEFGKVLVDPRTYNKVWEKATMKPPKQEVWSGDTNSGWHKDLDSGLQHPGVDERINGLEQGADSLPGIEKDSIPGIEYATHKPKETWIDDGEWYQSDAGGSGRQNSFPLAGDSGAKVETIPERYEVNIPARYETPSGYSVTVEDLRYATGVEQMDTALQTAHLRPKDTDLSIGEGVDFMQRRQAEKYLGGVSPEQLQYAYDVKPLTGNTLYMPVPGLRPNSGQILGRLFVNPLIKTLNHWPILATRYLDLVATRKFEDNNKGSWSEKWSPLLSEAIYATALPMLENSAMIWNLKLDMNKKMGLFSDVQYSREQFFRRAAVDGIFTEISRNKDDIDALAENLHLDSSDKDTLHQIMVKDIDDKERMKQLSIAVANMAQKHEISSRVEAIMSGFSADDNIDPLIKEFTESERRDVQRVLSSQTLDPDNKRRIITDMVQTHGVSNYEVFKNMGGSRMGLLSKTAGNVLFSELPIALISGNIEVQTNKMLEGKESWDAMKASLGKIMSTSLTRGLLWYSYGKSMFNRQVAAIALHDETPLEGFTFNPVSEADIIAARIDGWLPLVDDRRFDAQKEYWQRGKDKGANGWQQVDKANLQAQLYEIGDTYNIDHSKLDLSKVDLANAIDAINKSPHKGEDIKLEFSDGGGKLRKVEAGKVSEWAPDYEFGEGAWRRIDSGDEGLQIISANNLLAYQNRVAAQDALASLSDTQERIARVKPNEKGQYELTVSVDIDSVADKDGYYGLRLKDYSKPALEPYTVVVAGTNDPAVPNGYLMMTPQDAHNKLQAVFTVHNGEIGPDGEYDFQVNGKSIETWGPYSLIRPAELMPTLVGSVSQGMFEFGWQSLAMGQPYTHQGKMSTYGWVSYLDKMKFLTSSAASGGLFNIMTQYATSTGVAQNFGVSKDVIKRIILTGTANTVLGQWLGMAPFIPVTGYKGMPFSMAANIQTGLETTETRYYPYWQYQRMNVVPHDLFWRSIKSGMVYRYGQTNLPNIDMENNNYTGASAGVNTDK